MEFIKKWNTKKKSLGHINSEMGAKKNYTNSTSFRLNGALKSTTTATMANSKLKSHLSNKAFDDIYFSEINESLDQPEAPNPHESAKVVANHNKAVALLRVAFAEGGGKTDPKKNLRLNAAIKRGKEIGVPQATLQQIIRKLKLMSEARPIALLQIRYQRKVFIVCTVLTRSQSEFQLQLMPTLKKHFAGFAPVLNLFDSYSYIDAIVPMNIGGDYLNMRNNVRRDSDLCGAMEVKSKDHETGTFRFRVDPLISANVAAALINKGYQIVDTACEFTPKRLVDLNSQERDAYNRFLWKLRQIPEIDGMFDNVRNSVANRLEMIKQ